MSTDELSLDLRLRFLESILLPQGPTPGPSPAPNSNSPSLTRRVANLNQELDSAISAPTTTEAIRRFVKSYELNEPLLRAPALSNPNPDELPPATKLMMVLEAEQELRQLERELREIDALDSRGVVGAGQLGEHAPLRPQLGELQTAVAPLATGYGHLDDQANALLGRYNDYISTLSEIFISWHEIVSAAEERLTVLEREKAQEATQDVS